MIYDFIILKEEQSLNRVKGDQLPDLDIQIYDNSVIPFTEVDLTALSVSLSMKKTKSTTPKIDDQPFTIVTPAVGLIKFEFQTNQIDEVGTYDCEIKVINTGKSLTLKRKFQIIIQDSVA